MNVEERPIESFIEYARNPRKNDPAVDAVAASLKEFGWQQPIVIDAEGVIVVGHTRFKAAQKLGLQSAPCVVALDLTPQQIKAYRLLDNKVHEKSAWDPELLDLELQDLDLDWSMFDVSFGELPGVHDATRDFDENPLDEKRDAYINGTIRQIVLYFDIPGFEQTMKRFEAVMTAQELASNTDVVLFLLDHYEASRSSET